MNVRLGGKKLEYSKTHIVFEAGPTHTGIESAKQLADLAKNAGADSVKFQTIDADRLMADKNILFEYSYLHKDPDGNLSYIPIKEPLYDILKRRYLSKDEWRELKLHCDSIGIHMFTTACYKDEVDFLVDELKIDSIKINSSDINQLDLIRYIARKGVNIQLDTGSSDLWEIEKAVIAIEEEGNENIIIHHCPSGYPARLESIHLNMIPTLKEMFPNYLIAFSDHNPGFEMDVAAISLGAGMVEKTITLDRFIKSCEHSYSLEGGELLEFTRVIRDVEVAFGDKRRILPPLKRVSRKNTRRSPYALRELKQGELIQAADFEFKRPGNGLSEEEFEGLLGTPLKEALMSNQPLIQ
ncbi:MAG: N-acetylneuraminate synthase family protein [Flavobacteriaceae bacterium]